MVWNRKAALPSLRRQRTIHARQQRLGVAPRHGDCHDLRQRDGFLHWNAFGAFHRSPPGRERIAGNQEVVSDRSALDVALGSPWPIWKHFAAREAVLSRIGIDQQAGGALLLRSEEHTSEL